MADSLFVPRIAALYELQMAYLEPRLKKVGMSLNTFQLLAAIQSAGPKASQVEVSRRLGISPATLSETVQVHIKKGFLEQVPSEVDRRVRVLRLTKDSNSKLKQVRKLLDDLEEIMLDGVSGSALRSCIAVMDAGIENAEAALARGVKS